MRNRFGGRDEAEEKFGWLQIKMGGDYMDSDFLPSQGTPQWIAIMDDGSGAQSVRRCRRTGARGQAATRGRSDGRADDPRLS